MGSLIDLRTEQRPSAYKNVDGEPFFLSGSFLFSCLFVLAFHLFPLTILFPAGSYFCPAWSMGFVT